MSLLVKLSIQCDTLVQGVPLWFFQSAPVSSHTKVRHACSVNFGDSQLFMRYLLSLCVSPAMGQCQLG